MATSVKRPLDDSLAKLGPEYLAALERYIAAGDEETLTLAYELGRRAMADDLGVLDMAVLHRAAVEGLVLPTAPAEQARVADAAAGFFHELLSPFEMKFRGYRSANDELRRLTEALRQQNQAIENVNRELESFSYSVSHDLRAPLRSIDGFSQILIEDFAAVLGDEGNKHLSRIRTATQRMSQLIDDLLGLSRVTRSELHRGDVDLSALVREIAERLQGQAPERACTFTIQPDVRASADARLLTIVFENLLTNAWKFTGKKPHAVISFGRNEHEGKRGPVYFVRDNGAGFSMEYATKLFAPFQRLHTNAEFEGTGIGLATVQRIVRRHGGEVWAEAEIDTGATFYFTL